MLTCQDVRRMALALPDVEEQDHWGRPSFRVRGKIFATLWEPENMAMVKLPVLVQEEFVQLHPRVFSAVPNHWGRQGATFVQLTRVGKRSFEDAMTAAWKRAAPLPPRPRYELVDQSPGP